MCQLFHADSLHMRMLCTYVGQGTEWVENHNARYDQLGSRGRTKEETNAAIVIDHDQIHTIQPWHVGIFTGRKKSGISPLIHRSPSVLGAKEHRIFLCIDFQIHVGVHKDEKRRSRAPFLLIRTDQIRSLRYPFLPFECECILPAELRKFYHHRPHHFRRAWQH